MQKINIYIDSCILYSDPFFKTRSSLALLRVAEECEATILVSKVVFEEAKSNYAKTITKTSSDYQKVTEKLKRFGYTKEYPTIEVSDAEQTWDDYYQYLVAKHNVSILKYDNNLLPEIVDRAVKRKKPFKESGQEFRDCIIWLSYAAHANKSSCAGFLLTKNSKDFFDSSGKLHPELQEDCSKIKIYTSIHDFLDTEKGILEIAKNDVLLNQIDLEEIEGDLIEMCSTSDSDRIYQKLYDYVSAIEPTYLDDEFYGCGYCDLDGMDIFDVNLDSKEVYNDDVVLKGTITTTCLIDYYMYNSVRDPGEDHHYLYKTNEHEVSLSIEVWTDKELELDFADISYGEIKIKA
jgi:hypothetical protein